MLVIEKLREPAVCLSRRQSTLDGGIFKTKKPLGTTGLPAADLTSPCKLIGNKNLTMDDIFQKLATTVQAACQSSWQQDGRVTHGKWEA